MRAPAPRPVERLTLAQARRVALAAQGFADRRPTGVPDRRALRRVVGHTALFQIDSVNVLRRAHYLPLFSRLGPYPVELLERAAYARPRLLFEYWGHEASLLPVELHPLLRWRMAEASTRAWGGMMRIAREQPSFVADVLAEIGHSGPVVGQRPRPPARGRPGQAGRAVVGLVARQARVRVPVLGRGDHHALPPRVRAGLRPARAGAPTGGHASADTCRLTRPSGSLLLRAARSHGVATERDLRDYFRLDVTEAKARLAELVEAGALVPMKVESWRNPGYALPDLRVPRRIQARALLAPFDPVVWERERTERLFGFRYRVELYVPAPKRVHGYYVLPFLLGDRLVARVDLKSDRAASALLVQAAWAEADAPAHTSHELAIELRSMADWLGLERVVAVQRGDLAAQLSSSLASLA